MFLTLKKAVFKLLLTVCVLAFLVVLGCPFYRIFRIPCPGCGLTRAWVCCLHGELQSAFRYHPLFLLAPPLILGFVFFENIPNKRKKYFFAIAILFFVYNLFRVAGIFSYFPDERFI